MLFKYEIDSAHDATLEYTQPLGSTLQGSTTQIKYGPNSDRRFYIKIILHLSLSRLGLCGFILCANHPGLQSIFNIQRRVYNVFDLCWFDNGPWHVGNILVVVGSTAPIVQHFWFQWIVSMVDCTITAIFT